MLHDFISVPMDCYSSTVIISCQEGNPLCQLMSACLIIASISLHSWFWIKVGYEWLKYACWNIDKKGKVGQDSCPCISHGSDWHLKVKFSNLSTCMGMEIIIQIPSKACNWCQDCNCWWNYNFFWPLLFSYNCSLCCRDHNSNRRHSSTYNNKSNWQLHQNDNCIFSWGDCCWLPCNWRPPPAHPPCASSTKRSRLTCRCMLSKRKFSRKVLLYL